MDKYYYLALVLFSLFVPFIRSFETTYIDFKRRWIPLFIGIFFMMLLFIPWDVAFANMEVWGFNERYLTGIYIINLPLEEWLFFIIVPYACLFIYEVLNRFLTWDPFKAFANTLSAVLGVALIVLSIVFYPKWYTALNFVLCGLFLFFHGAWLKPIYTSKFYRAFIVILLPFLAINGALTGFFTEEPVVWYNNAENLGIRLGTIPIEDIVYNLLMLLMVTSVYEVQKRKRKIPELKPSEQNTA